MGVLDDAIREHLELRRRHGAPEAELKREQDEALGPARREVEPPARVPEPEGAAAPQEIEAEPSAEPRPGPDTDEIGADGADLPETELLGADDAELNERFDPERLRRAATPDEDDRSATVHGDLLAGDAELVEEEEPLAEPPALSPEEEEAEYGAEGAPPSRFAPAFDDDELGTVESDALEDAYGRLEDSGASVGEEDEDVLEETPDFLQETPEHDRLWFEQKPPRDFDLDDK